MKPVHIDCLKEDVSELVLMPGDPLRAKYIAENFLEDVKLVNTVRNMFGYTGYYNGVRISVFSSGMGIPSMGIYAYELIKFYGVKKIIRIGTCGSLSKDVHVLDLIVPTEARSLSTFALSFSQDDSKVFPASQSLNEVITSLYKGNNLHTGKIITSDIFDVYSDITPTLNLLDFNDPIGCEMECFALFHLAQREKVEASAIITVVDSKFEKDKNLTPQERETSLNEMITLALNAITKKD